MYGDRFVARFKYATERRGKAAFQKFLIANFTVEEYFNPDQLPPLAALRSKGFVG